MASKKDTFELSSKLMKGVTDKENEAVLNDLKIYKSPTMRFSISPLYQRYIGKTVTVAFNGNFKKFPVDGTSFEISQGHYNALMKYLRHIDKQIKIANQRSQFMDSTADGDFKRV